MMLGEQHRPNPAVHVPPWTLPDDDVTINNCISHSSSFSPTSSASEYSPLYLQEALKALQRYLPSSSDAAEDLNQPDSPVDAYSCDHFRMYEFKVRRCARGRSHDWTECPYAHPGEKARRRDPRKYHYSGTACPDFRKGNCKKGDACEYAHGVFECWLHPARYRTQPCKDGASCRRKVCFFAHSPDQLRVLPASQCLSPVSPPASPPAAESPPMSPMMSRSVGSGSFNEVVASLRNLQLGKASSFPPSWGIQVGGGGGSGFGSPRGSVVRPGFLSLPATPTQIPARGIGFWDRALLEEEEEVMERVESGRDIRKRMLEKLSKENSLERVDPDLNATGSAPDVGWVSELVK